MSTTLVDESPSNALSGKDQNWRFATIRRYRVGSLQPAPELGVDVLQGLHARSGMLDEVVGQATLAGNQIVSPFSLDEAALARGVQLKPFSESTQSFPVLGGTQFQALNSAHARTGVFLEVPDNVELEKPIFFFHWTVQGASFPQVHVRTGAHSKLRLVEVYLSANGDTGFNIATTQVSAGVGSQVSRIVVRNWNPQTTAVHMEHLTTGRDAQLRSINLNIGGGAVRQESVISAEGQGADARLHSLAIAGAGQEFDQRTLQAHEAPDSRSDLLFKNALLAGGRTIFSGMIRVAPEAQHTDAYQTNRNLLLDPSAEANSLPGLEILANDVKCSHGATSGQIDEDQLFYMRSRGISDRLARQLLVFGFFEEIIEKIQLPNLEDLVRKWIEERFQSQPTFPDHAAA